jgi:type II secretion system protein L
MRLLGVDRGEGELRLAHGERVLGRLRLTAFERLPLGAPPAVGPSRRRPPRVSIALPAAAAAHRILVLPFRDRRRLARTVPLELLGQLPLELEDATVAFAPLGPAEGGTRVLAAAARREDLVDLVAPLAAAGLSPDRVELAPLPLWNLVPPEPADLAILLADGSRSALALRRGGRLAGLRALGASGTEPATLAAEARWSLAALGGAPPTVVVAGADATPGLAEALATATGAAVAPIEAMACLAPPGGAAFGACALAAGLAAAGRGLAPHLVFDPCTGAPATPLRRAAALAAAALVIGFVDLALVHQDLVRRDAALAGAIRAEAEAVLPGARLAAPRAELEAALAARTRRRADAGSGGGLALLRELSARVPPSLRLDLDELVIDADALRLHGRSESFDAVDGLRRALAASPLLTEVRADETRTTVDGRRVEFRLHAARRPVGGTSS